MKQKSGPDKAPAEQVLKDIRRQTRRQYSAEEKIRIVLEGLRGEENISELCRREGIAASMYYGWSKEFLEAGKRRLAGDTALAPHGRLDIDYEPRLPILARLRHVAMSAVRSLIIFYRRGGTCER